LSGAQFNEVCPSLPTVDGLHHGAAHLNDIERISQAEIEHIGSTSKGDRAAARGGQIVSQGPPSRRIGEEVVGNPESSAGGKEVHRVGISRVWKNLAGAAAITSLGRGTTVLFIFCVGGTDGNPSGIGG